MADGTHIQWTEATWNPVVGCEHVSPGCDHCYAARETSGRLAHLPLYAGLAKAGRFTGEVRLVPERLDQPLRWHRPRRVFVNSMSDLFHDDVPREFIADVFAVMALAARHTFQLLTKRHGRMRSLLNDPTFPRLVANRVYKRHRYAKQPTWPLPNVWLGVSVEDQHWADVRIPPLLDTPAAVRWVSAEPLLGSVDLRRWLVDPTFNPAYRVARCGQGDRHARHIVEHGPDQPRNCPGTGTGYGDLRRLAWLIVGGESGPGARRMSLVWAESLVDQCRAAGVPVFVKQLGAWWAARSPAAVAARDRKGGDPQHWPQDLRVREYPAGDDRG